MTAGQPCARSQIESANAFLEHCRWPLALVVVMWVGT